MVHILRASPRPPPLLHVPAGGGELSRDTFHMAMDYITSPSHPPLQLHAFPGTFRIHLQVQPVGVLLLTPSIRTPCVPLGIDFPCFCSSQVGQSCEGANQQNRGPRDLAVIKTMDCQG